MYSVEVKIRKDGEQVARAGGDGETLDAALRAAGSAVGELKLREGDQVLRNYGPVEASDRAKDARVEAPSGDAAKVDTVDGGDGSDQ